MQSIENSEGLQVEQNLERRLGELEQLVARLEQSDCSITESIQKYSEGMALALECRRYLNELGRRVAVARDKAMQDFQKLEQETNMANGQWNPQMMGNGTPNGTAPNAGAPFMGNPNNPAGAKFNGSNPNMQGNPNQSANSNPGFTPVGNGDDIPF